MIPFCINCIVTLPKPYTFLVTNSEISEQAVVITAVIKLKADLIICIQ